MRITILWAVSLLAAATAHGQATTAREWWIPSQPPAPADAKPAEIGTPEHMLGVLVYTKLTVRLDEVPAREAIEYLRAVLGINILGRYRDDKAGFGIDPETPITLHADDRPALEILELVLAQCEDLEGCTWQLRRGFIEVGTKARLSQPGAQQIRHYSIRDLMQVAPYFDNTPKLNLDAALNQGGGGGGGRGGFGGQGGGSGRGGTIFDPPGDERPRADEQELSERIVQLIQETIEPEAWSSKGGDYATLRYNSGILIVRAPDYIQRQIGGYPFPIRPPQPR